MPLSRRTLLATFALGFAGACTGRIPASRDRLPLAFSTLGTPDWPWESILDEAARHGYATLELRSLEGTEDLPARREFAAARIEATRRDLERRGLHVVCLGSSANLHEREPAARAAQLAEGRRFIDLAASLGAPFVRVFGDRYPEGEPAGAVVERVAAGLRELGDYAGPRGVTVLIESHGDFTDSPTLLDLMRRADTPHAAILWDAHHTFVASGEAPEDTVRQLGSYIRHVHLKDSVPEGEGRRYVLTGAGDVPVRRQVAALVERGYRGNYSFEWEKRWHPEIEDPSVAIPHYASVLRGFLAGR